MINKLIAVAARFAFGAKVVAALGWANDKAKGHRSEIILGVMAISFALGKVGVIPDSAADSINAILGPMLPVTLAEKFSKAKALIEKVAPAAPADEVKPA